MIQFSDKIILIWDRNIFSTLKEIQPWNTEWCLATYFQSCYVVFVWFFIWTFCELVTDGFVHAFVFTRLSSSTWASPDWPSLMRWICVSTLTPFTTSCSGEEKLLTHRWLFFNPFAARAMTLFCCQSKIRPFSLFLRVCKSASASCHGIQTEFRKSEMIWCHHIFVFTQAATGKFFY